MDDLSQREAQVKTYVSQNNTKAAVQLLFEMIVECAHRRDFVKAEALRTRMLEVDALALTEIIQSAEIIEEAKSQSIDRAHVSTWSKLYATLSQEEVNAVYFALKKIEVAATRSVFNQGERDSRLYLVNRGELAMLWRAGESETLLKRIGAGEVAVGDGFFSESVCTISLVALSKVELAYLEKAQLVEWEGQFPALENKLREFCQSAEDIPSLLKRHKIDRRSHLRVRAPGSLAVQLMSGSGTPVGKPFRGDFADISRGGTAFFAGIRDRKTSRALLGRAAVLTIPIQKAVPPIKLTKKGFLVAISHSPFEGYCIHVEFEEQLSEQEAHDISASIGVARR